MITESNKRVSIKVKPGITTALGVTIGQKGINFAIAVENGITCRLLIFAYGENQSMFEVTLNLENKKGDIYTILIEGLKKGRYEYIYELDGKQYLDPYSRQIIGKEVWGKEVEETKVRCAFDCEAFDWEQDKPLEIPYHEVIMYSLHVRGFTKHSSSKVKNKGTFEGIIEKIPYLKELGINQIELMPAYEFNEIIPRQENSMMIYKKFDENKQYAVNYWGYTKANYFAPKASYSSSDNCIVSFKNMVKELHKNKIEVIMEFYFEEGSNQNLIMDCLKYWVEEYHIDGVHINSNVAPVTAIATSPRLGHTKIMTEGFELLKIYQNDKVPKFKNLAEYNDGFLVDMRRFLKGDEDQLNKVVYHIRNNPKQCATINYMVNHNGFNLVDLVTYDVKHNEANGENNKDGSTYNYSWNCGIEGPSRKKSIIELRKKQIKNAIILLILSQGVPKIFSGDEIGNTQKGNNNPYCQDNEITWVNWNQLKKNSEIFEFTKALIKFRKDHLILHNPKELRIMDYLSCGYPDLSYHGKKAWFPEFENYNRQVGIMYCGQYAKDAKQKEDDFIYIAYNMHWSEYEFALPNLPSNKKWRNVIDTSTDMEEKPRIVKRSIKVKERSIVILVGK